MRRIVYFRVLGALAVETDDGTPHTPQALKLRTLLALLCLNDGRPLSAAQLIDGLWSGTPPRTASTALQVYVSRLRKHLAGAGFGASGLLTRPPGYMMELAPLTLDLHRFESLCLRAAEARTAGRLEEASRLLSQALGLWSGPALADLRTVPLLQSLGHQLDEKRSAALEERAETELLLGRHKPLIGELYGLIDEQPMRETFHGLLMLALYRSGRPAEALMIYNRIRRVLIDEIGIEPGPRLRQLQQSVLSRDADLEEHTLAHLAC
ncbi:AfsR/SARP family transcriptional regulator [Streptomyces sp. NBC_00536]|uniref:AfsR/SARP family transcriptional regulator n=1 Tax=Streptomyces sp. NBC_00536 TaxID=2975769 RepID=UPI002E8232F4|nr:AfsR/SARP family transcriptional regulator [Streptomyces sp. NBC_00536]WUC81767.1 AfsR/SARP family transcriptional regulator [Streptomyces sp. NBC_00536]